MGILESGIFGNVKGKISHLSFQIYNGRNTVRVTGGNKINNSEAQLLQQAKFKVLGPLVRVIFPLIQPEFFEFYPASKSLWDVFIKLNLRLLDVGNIYSTFMPGAGRLQQPLSPQTAYQPSSGLFGAVWVDGGLGNVSSDDSIFIIVYSPSNSKAWVSSPAVLRSDELIQLDIGYGYDYSDLKSWFVGYGYRNGNRLSFDSVFSQPVYYPPS